MDKRESTINYFNGIKSYSLFFDNVFFGKTECDKDLIWEKYRISYAKVALIANFIMLKKEDMIENKGELVYESKIIDETLEKSMDYIATKVGDEFKVGEYIAPAAKIVAKIRNKFAHGDFTIDIENNSLIMIADDKRMEIDIDKLATCFNFEFLALMGKPKTSVIERINFETYAPSVLNNQPIVNNEQLKTAISASTINTFTMRTLDGRLLTTDALNCFIKTINTYNSLQRRSDKKIVVNSLRDEADKHSCTFNFTKSKNIPQEMLDKVYKVFESNNDFFNLPLYEQSLRINMVLKNLYVPESMDLIIGNFVNLFILNNLEKANITDIFKKIYSLVITNESDINATIALAKFNALFCYPLEHIYKENKYDLNRENQLDFEKLDLSFLEPDILDSEKGIIEEAEKRVSSYPDKIIKVQNNLEISKENVKNILLLKEDPKHNITEEKIKILEEKSIRIAETKDKINNDYLLAKDILDKIREDFEKNPIYFRNRAIIEDIRNAISHGHVEVINNNATFIDDNYLDFTDIYNGQIVFHLKVMVKDFEQIFNDNNIIYISEFLNNRMIKNDSDLKCRK